METYKVLFKIWSVSVVHYVTPYGLNCFVDMEFIKKKRAHEDSDKPPEVRIRINVGGTVFETWRSTLERIPGTRLALLAVLGESDDTWDKDRKEFFFDRHPGVFSMVIQYYRSEELHTDQNFCGNIIQAVSYAIQGFVL